MTLLLYCSSGKPWQNAWTLRLWDSESSGKITFGKNGQDIVPDYLIIFHIFAPCPANWLVLEGFMLYAVGAFSSFLYEVKQFLHFYSSLCIDRLHVYSLCHCRCQALMNGVNLQATVRSDRAKVREVRTQKHICIQRHAFKIHLTCQPWCAISDVCLYPISWLNLPKEQNTYDNLCTADPLTCFLCRQTAEGPAGGLWCPSDGSIPVSIAPFTTSLIPLQARTSKTQRPKWW